MLEERNYLFISGCDRSGTTALTRLLNAHSQISLGMERYKFLANDKQKILSLTKDRFRRESFFDINEVETNIDWEYFYEALNEKYDNTKYVGDKNPRYFQNYLHFSKTFPKAKHIFIIRNPTDVANSWKVRAEKDSDVNWLKSNDVARSVVIWNKSLSSAMSAIKNYGIDMHVVNYEKLFSGVKSELRSILEFLCIEDEIEEVFNEMTKNWVEISSKEKILTVDEISHIKRHANTNLAECLFGLYQGDSISTYTDAVITKGFGIFNTGIEKSLVRHKRVKKGNVDYVSSYLGCMPVYKEPQINDMRNAFYGGIKFDHYGHFILESLARLSSYNGEDVIVWHGKDKRFRPWQLDMLEKLGFGKTEHVVVDESVAFSSITIAEPNCVIANKFTIKHSEFLRKYSEYLEALDCTITRKVWISRAVGKNLFSWNNEKIIEDMLALDGWEIVTPQSLSVSEQVNLFNGKNIIAGIEGSAFHSVVFSNSNQCQLKMFTRKKEVNSNYHMIEYVVSARHKYFYVPSDKQGNVDILDVLTHLEFPNSKIPLKKLVNSYSGEESDNLTVQDVLSRLSVD